MKNILYYCMEVFSWLSFLGLSIGLGSFVKEIWNDFVSKRTNDRVYSQENEFYEHPTITICFDPQIKPSALKKYNASVKDILNLNEKWNDISVTNVSEFVSDIGYKYGSDFEIHHKSTQGSQTDLDFNIEKFINYFHGTCFIVHVDGNQLIPIRKYILLSLKFNITEEDLPKVKIFFSSKNNSHAILWQQWMEGERFGFAINLKEELYYMVNLRKEIKIHLKETSNCSETTGFYNCVAKRYV